MEAFIATVRNQRLLERLDRAIGGRGVFRHFKDVHLDYPAEPERWFQFKRERLQLQSSESLECNCGLVNSTLYAVISTSRPSEN